MNPREFRAAVTSEVENWRKTRPLLPVFYENGPQPDEHKVGPVWVDFEIDWGSAQLIGFTRGTTTRKRGSLVFRVFVRDSEGTGVSDDILDSLDDVFCAKQIGTGVTGAPARVAKNHSAGWHIYSLVVPFHMNVLRPS